MSCSPPQSKACQQNGNQKVKVISGFAELAVCVPVTFPQTMWENNEMWTNYFSPSGQFLAYNNNNNNNKGWKIIMLETIKRREQVRKGSYHHFLFCSVWLNRLRHDLIWFDLSTAWYMIHVFLDHRLSTQSIDWVDIWMTDPSSWRKFWHRAPPHRNCLMASTIDAQLGLFVQKV